MKMHGITWVMGGFDAWDYLGDGITLFCWDYSFLLGGLGKSNPYTINSFPTPPLTTPPKPRHISDELDADITPLYSTTEKKYMERDIVQFVPFADFKDRSYYDLARCTLDEVPREVINCL